MLKMKHSSTLLQVMGFLIGFFLSPHNNSGDFQAKIRALSLWAHKLKGELLSFTTSQFLRNPRPNYNHQKPLVHSGKRAFSEGQVRFTMGPPLVEGLVFLDLISVEDTGV